MLDDSLKTCRTLHRVLITVNIAAIVFALSLAKPEYDSQMVEQLRTLKQIPFRDYEGFVLAEAKKAYGGELAKRAQGVAAELEKAKLMVFGVDKIGKALGEFPHIGRLLVGQTVLADIESAKISSIEVLLDAFCDDRPAQVLLPKTDRLASRVVEYLSSGIPAGSRIEEVRFDLRDEDFSVNSFLPGETYSIPLYFEVIPAEGAIPVYNTLVECEIKDLTGSGAQSWFLKQEGATKVLKEEQGKVRLLPDMRPFPDGTREKTMGMVLAEALERIRSSSPESQSIALLGTKVPGKLAAIAAPLVSLLVMLYLLGHVDHLAGLVNENEAKFREFAWIPLHKGNAWLLDVYGTVLALPVVSFLLLTWKLAGFGRGRTVSVLLTGCLCALGCVFALRIVRRIRVVRRMLRTTMPSSNSGA